MAKKKSTRKRASNKYKASQVKEDTKQRRKYGKGGRIEAYTFGETTTRKGKNWPF